MFKSNWNILKSFKIKPIRQNDGGSIHYKKEFESIQHILGIERWSIELNVLKDRYKKIKIN